MQAPEPALIVHNAPNSVKEFRDKRGDGVPRKGWRREGRRPCAGHREGIAFLPQRREQGTWSVEDVELSRSSAAINSSLVHLAVLVLISSSLQSEIAHDVPG